jgi:hypothetical protein
MNQERWLGFRATVSMAGFVLVLMFLGWEAEPGQDCRGMVVFLTMFGLALIKLWLVGGQTLAANCYLAHDDAHYINLAGSLRGMSWTVPWLEPADRLGHVAWLGPYNQYTLMKGPFYPLWLALGSLVKVPLLLGQHLFYIVACALTVAALSPLMPRRLALLSIYGLLLFNPMTYTLDVLHVIREGIVPAETLMVVGFLIGVHTRRDRSLRAMSLWAAGLGVALGAFWLTREDGIWQIPSVVLLLGYTVLSLVWQRRADWPRRVACCAMPLAIWGAMVAGVCWLNWVNYGIYTTCEFRWPKFVGAYCALSRVEHCSWRQYYLLPRETRQRIYAVSPAFRELEPVLEGELGKAWAACGRQGVWAACGQGSDDLLGTYIIFAMRDAVAKAGHYQSGKTAAAFYGKLADEVNRACDSGLLQAGPRRYTMGPLWRQEYVQRLIEVFPRGLRQVIGFQGFQPVPACSSSGTPTESILLGFRAITHERLSPLLEVSSDWPSKIDHQKIRILQGIGASYRTAMRWLGPLAGLVLLGAAGIGVARKRLPYYLVLAVALGLGIAARVGMLALTEVSGWAPVSLLYLTPVFPLLLLSVALAAIPLCRVAEVAISSVRDRRMARPMPELH